MELNARSVEPPDDRIVIVGIDRPKPLNDRVLFQTLTKLQQYHPQAIGLDIYRDIPMGEGHGDLANLLQQESIVSSCLMSGNSKKFPGVAAPEGVKTSPALDLLTLVSIPMVRSAARYWAWQQAIAAARQITL